MKCPGCGVDVVEQAVFCHLCGARLDFSNSETADFSSDPNAGGERTATGQTARHSTSQPAAHINTSPPQTNAERFRSLMGANDDAEEANLWEGGYCVKAMMGNWLLGIFLSACFLALGVWTWSKGWNASVVWWGVLIAFTVLWLYLFVLLLRRRLGVHYRLTSQRFFHESGILRHTTDLIEVIDMDDITFEQTLVDRFTGVGSVHIVSSDRSHPELTIKGIENVKAVAAKMQDARHTERLRRGLHIEQV